MGSERVEPEAAFRFYIELEGIIVGAFMECSGLTIERAVETYIEGGVNDYVHILPGRTDSAKGRITLKRGMTVSDALWIWYQQGVRNSQPEAINLSILLSDDEGEVVRRWDFVGVIPLKWVGPSLSASSAEIAVETFEMGFGGSAASVAPTVQRQVSTDAPRSEEATDLAENVSIDRSALAREVYKILQRDLALARDRLGHQR